MKDIEVKVTEIVYQCSACAAKDKEIERLKAVLLDCKETIIYAQTYLDKSLSAYYDCEDSLQLIEQALKENEE